MIWSQSLVAAETADPRASARDITAITALTKNNFRIIISGLRLATMAIPFINAARQTEAPEVVDEEAGVDLHESLRVARRRILLLRSRSGNKIKQWLSLLPLLSSRTMVW